MDTAASSRGGAPGVRYARWAGTALGALLVVAGLASLARESGWLQVTGAFWAVYGILLALPYGRIRPDGAWRAVFAVLTAASVLFVFVMIALVMFAYIDAAERGERLGVPGWQGTCIFIALMQVPAVLFERRPDLLD